MGVTAKCSVSVPFVSTDVAMHVIRDILNRCPDAKDYIRKDGSPTFSEGAWHHSETELRAFTATHTGLTIQLDKVGHYDGPFHDRYYFSGGKMQHCPGKIIVHFDDFDTSKLS